MFQGLRIDDYKAEVARLRQTPQWSAAAPEVHRPG